MSEDQERIELEEEEHTSELTLPVLKRILGLLKPHKWWAIGFFVAENHITKGRCKFCKAKLAGVWS